MNTQLTDRLWYLRDKRGRVTTMESLIHVAGAIRHGTLDAEHEIRRAAGSWRRLGDIFDPVGFSTTVRALGHLNS